MMRRSAWPRTTGPRSIHGQQHHQRVRPTNITSGQFIKAEVPLRPRVLTLQFGYKF